MPFDRKKPNRGLWSVADDAAITTPAQLVKYQDAMREQVVGPPDESYIPPYSVDEEMGQIVTGGPVPVNTPYLREGVAPPEPTPDVPAAPALEQVAPANGPKPTLPTNPLEQAQQQSSKYRLLAGMHRAGTTLNSAFSGNKPDYSFVNQMMEQANRPVADAKDNIAMAEKQRVAALKAQEMEPNSPMNVRAREAFKKTVPNIAGLLGPTVDRLTASELDKYAEMEGPNAKAKFEREKFDAENLNKQNKFGQEQLEFNEKQLHNQAQEDMWSRMPMGMNGQLTAAQQAVNDRKNVERTDKLGALPINARLGEYITALATFDQLAPGFVEGKVDQYKTSPWDNAMTSKLATSITGGGSEYLAGDKAVALNKAFQNMKDMVMRDRTGAVINASEQPFYENLFSSLINSPPAAKADAIRQLYAAIYRNLKQRQASMLQPTAAGMPSPLDLYEQQGGVTFRDPIFARFADSQSQMTGTAPQVTPGQVPGIVKQRVEDTAQKLAPITDAVKPAINAVRDVAEPILNGIGDPTGITRPAGGVAPANNKYPKTAVNPKSKESLQVDSAEEEAEFARRGWTIN